MDGSTFNYGINTGIGVEVLGDDELALTFGYQSAPQAGMASRRNTGYELRRAFRTLIMEFSTGEKRMQAIRNLGLALAVLFVAGCASFTGDASPSLPRTAQWGIVPMVNYSQTPQAGERSEHPAQRARSHGLQPRVYPASTQGEQALMDDNERLAGALDWAREQKLDYVVTGSVEEWQYKNGLDGEPAVGISLRVLDADSGRCLEQSGACRRSRESLGHCAKVLDTLVGALRFE
jgi:hypothetical protein